MEYNKLVPSFPTYSRILYMGPKIILAFVVDLLLANHWYKM